MSRSELPKDWRIASLEDVADFINGYSFKSTDWDISGLPIIRIQNLNDGSKPFNRFSAEIDEKYRVRSGDVLISWSASLGAYFWEGGDAWLNQHIFKAVINENTIDRDFFFWVMKNRIDKIAESARGSTMKHVTRKTFINSTIPLPPLPEQRAIARALRAVQGAREARLREMALERERKAALMEHLFACDSWNIAPLEKCAFVQTGVTKGRKFENGNNIIKMPYLRVANVQDGYLDLEEIQTIEIRESELERFLLQPGDILLTEGGDFDKLGRGFIWQGQIPQCVHQNHIFAVRVDKDRLIPEYLAYLIQSEYGKAYFLSVAHRTTHLACINSTKLKAFPTLIPDLAEQKRIVDVLAACDSKIAALDHEARLHDELFQAMLEELMSGRLPVGGAGGGRGLS